MRTEREMLDLILETARRDERIRAVIMNGSRVNPNAPRDCFQDFDIVYLVTDLSPFRKNLEWIKRFGELMILQMPEDMGDRVERHGEDVGAHVAHAHEVVLLQRGRVGENRYRNRGHFAHPPASSGGDSP